MGSGCHAGGSSSVSSRYLANRVDDLARTAEGVMSVSNMGSGPGEQIEFPRKLPPLLALGDFQSVSYFLCLFVCLFCWLVGWLVGRSVGRSVGRLVGWSVGRLVGWLVGWLVSLHCFALFFLREGGRLSLQWFVSVRLNSQIMMVS